MTANRAAGLFQRVRAEHDEGDADLLRRFADAHDAAAFAVLVRRYGPLVLGVCRRTLGHVHDAEDAFQAVFLVLAQKAGRLRDARLLSAFLYGVAWRVAKKAKRRAARRREESRAVLPEQPTAGEPVNDLGTVLDEELAALPAWYRDAILACDVEQLSRADAAAKLGIPEGTLSSRLAAGRKRLADRLARRGVTLALPLLATMTTAGVSEALIQQAVDTAVQWAAGGAVAKPITELTREGLTMIRKLMLLGTGILAASVVGVGLADEPKKAVEKPPEAKPAEVKGDAKPTPEVVRYAAPRLRKAIELPIKQLESLTWMPDGKRFAIIGSGSIKLSRNLGEEFGYTNGTGVFFYPADPPVLTPATVFLPLPGETLLSLTPDGRSAVVASGRSGRINSQKRIARVPVFGADGKPLKAYPLEGNHAEPTTSLAMEPEYGEVLGYTADGKTLATIEFDQIAKTGKIVLRSAETGEPTKTLPVGAGLSVVTARDYTRVAYAVRDEPQGNKPNYFKKFEVLIDGPTKATWAATAPAGMVPFEARFSADGERLLLMSFDPRTLEVRDRPGPPPPKPGENHRTVTGYEAVTGRQIFQFSTKDYFIRDVQTSFDGRLAAVHTSANGRNDSARSLVIFDTATGSVVKQWPLNSISGGFGSGPTPDGFRWAFSPTEAKLLVAEPGESRDMTSVGLWEFPTTK